MVKVHRAALEILETIGMGEVPQVVVDQALAKGCRLTETGRLSFPAAFVEDTIAGAGRNFVLHGRDPKHDIEVSDRKVYYGTGGAAVP